MVDNGHFENFENFENQLFFKSPVDINFLNGLLSAFQFLNHKTDCQFNFSLKEYPKNGQTVEGCLIKVYQSSIKSSTIELDKAKEIVSDWLFSFFTEHKNYSRRVYLEDRTDNFSISYLNNRNSFINEFFYCLVQAVNPIDIYNIDLSTRILGNGGENSVVCFEAEDNLYVLALAWSD